MRRNLMIPLSIICLSIASLAQAETTKKIHTIQGSGPSSPLVSATVTIEGVVTGDFQGTTELNGFFVQEEDADTDSNPSTSEGIFVYSGVNVNRGDIVAVTGQVAEYYDLTEIVNPSVISIISSGNPLPTPTTVSLPVGSTATFEAMEGMLLTFPQDLVVNDSYFLGRYGSITLASKRWYQYTQRNAPDISGYAAHIAARALDQLLLDDGKLIQNPDPVVFPGFSIAYDTPLRAGDTVVGLTGVLSYSSGAYRLHATNNVNISQSNSRAISPPEVPGQLKVAFLNVLNYFSTISNSLICGPDGNLLCRGANSDTELIRQRDKLSATLTGLDAAILGFSEIENHATDEALIDLTTGINGIMGSGTYSRIDAAPLGTDAIKVAILYKPAVVAPTGAYAVLDSSVDPTFDDMLNRPVLAQTFLHLQSDNTFTVAIVHLKSKGSGCDSLGDPDTMDGQGNCNLTRLSATNALKKWLAGDPTGSGNSNILVLGDFNSYAKEDPVSALTAEGFTDLLGKFEGETGYSYIFSGESGRFDYAFASSSLLPCINGSALWHINSDEPVVFDYNVEFKSAGQISSFYRPTPYRSSDHDPVLVGITLGGLSTMLHYMPAILSGTVDIGDNIE